MTMPPMPPHEPESPVRLDVPHAAPLVIPPPPTALPDYQAGDIAGGNGTTAAPSAPPIELPHSITSARLPRWAGWAVPLGFAIGGASALPSGISPGIVVPVVLIVASAFIYIW